MGALTGFGVALAVAVGLGFPVLVALRRWRVVDVPGHRSSHVVATVRGGGIAVVGGLFAGVVAASVSGSSAASLVVGTAGMGALGLADDVRRVAPLRRLGLQALFAGAALPWMLEGLAGSVGWQVVFAAGVWCWLIAFVNACNFMDGINGLAVAQAVIGGGVWWAIGTSQSVDALAAAGAILAGAALGFAPYNFPHARAFLGDSGSYGIGAWIAATVVIALRAGITPVSVLAPVSLFLVDTGTTIVRRVIHREPWYEAHRSHAYQRLVIAGWSHVATTGFVTALMLVTSLIGLAALGAPIAGQAWASVGIAAVLSAYLASPIVVERLQYRAGSR